MIPKTIHYIWLGGKPLPKLAEKCIESWKKFCPDYEIKRWDETNVNLDKYKYCRQAYDSKKYAFASDVLRFDIVNQHGGIYMDIDVELIKPIDTFLQHKAFFGFESQKELNPGLIFGAEKGTKELTDILNDYKKRSFLDKDNNPILKTICTFTTDYFEAQGLKANNTKQEIDKIHFYPSEYFNPINQDTHIMKKTKKTHGIHHFLASWYTPKQKFKLGIKKFLNVITFGGFGKCLAKRKQKNRS